MPKSLKVAVYISMVIFFLRRIRRKVLDPIGPQVRKWWNAEVERLRQEKGPFFCPWVPKWVEPYLPEERENPEELEQLQREEAEYYYGKEPENTGSDL